MNAKSKYWVFTLNNYTQEDYTTLSEARNNEEIGYLVAGREVGESGTPHLQGYVEFKRRIRGRTISTILPCLTRAHFELRRGTAEQAAQYCQKEDNNCIEFGCRSQPQQGRRSDIQSCIEAIKSGASMSTLWKEHTSAMVRYDKGLTKARLYLQPVPERVIRNLEEFPYDLTEIRAALGHSTISLVGPPGTFKTSLALALLPKALFVSQIDDLSGFAEQYEGIIFDDMDFTHMPRTSQIHLVDYDFERSIYNRYSNATIPAKTPKIFTGNEYMFLLSDGAISRRVIRFEIRDTQLVRL